MPFAMQYAHSLAGQILESHLDRGRLVPGEEVRLRIDQTLTQDATGTMVYLQFMALGVERVRTRRSVSYVDHNTVQAGFESADDHRFLQDTAARYGVLFSRPGNGISHQVHLERFGVPGQTLLGSDSHTPTAGGLGMLAFGAGGMDVALAMAGIPFALRVPKVLAVRLRGTLPPWVGAKDVILHLLGRLTVKGGLGRILEYRGPGVEALSVPERATITNMGAELGAWTSLFPSDGVTRAFLKAQAREYDWQPLFCPDTAYADESLDLDLSTLEPLVACPHSPDAVVPVRQLDGKVQVDQVAIGSCTNSSYRDLLMVSRMLEGRRVHPEVSLVIAPGSRQVLSMLARGGALLHLIEAGARILEVACGPCIGMTQAPCSGGVSVRTFNRNFKGRSGTPDARIYLAGPQVAVAAALTGRLVHPEEAGLALPRVEEPDRYVTDDSLIIPPPPPGEPISIRMGPNIRPLPEPDPLPDALSLPLLLKLGDNITTDDILPGGAKVLPLRSNLPAISEFVFSLLEPGFAKRAEASGPSAVLGGENYGQGSSREHAALAPRYLGVRVVLARSFARLHRANLINFGILPVLVGQEVYEALGQGDILELEGLCRIVASGRSLPIRVRGRQEAFMGLLDLSEEEREAILAGSRLRMVRTTLEALKDSGR